MEEHTEKCVRQIVHLFCVVMTVRSYFLELRKMASNVPIVDRQSLSAIILQVSLMQKRVFLYAAFVAIAQKMKVQRKPG